MKGGPAWRARVKEQTEKRLSTPEDPHSKICFDYGSKKRSDLPPESTAVNLRCHNRISFERNRERLCRVVFTGAGAAKEARFFWRCRKSLLMPAPIQRKHFSFNVYMTIIVIVTISEDGMAKPGRTWGVAKAKANLSAVIDRALAEGPQTITRSGRKAVMVVSAEEWARKTQRKGNLAEFSQRLLCGARA